jgi:hypothetical protein
MVELFKLLVLALVIASEIRRCKTELPHNVHEIDEGTPHRRINWVPTIICLAPPVHYMIEAWHVMYVNTVG